MSVVKKNKVFSSYAGLSSADYYAREACSDEIVMLVSFSGRLSLERCLGECDLISDFRSEYFLEVMIKPGLHKIGKTLSETEVLEQQGPLNDCPR